MKQKDWLLDHLIKDAIEQDIKNIPPPLRSKEATWAEIQRHLHPPKRSIKPWLTRFSVACLVIILLFSLFVMPNQPARAWGWFVQYFEEIQGSITSIFINRGTTIEEALPTDDALRWETSAIHHEIMQLEEAEALAAFPIKLPKELPGQYALQHVRVHLTEQRPSEDIELVYSDGITTFSIRQMGFSANSNITISLDHEDIQVQSEEIGQTKVYWLNYEDDRRNLFWSTAEQQYIIEGPLSEEEMLLIFHAMF